MKSISSQRGAQPGQVRFPPFPPLSAPALHLLFRECTLLWRWVDGSGNVPVLSTLRVCLSDALSVLVNF